MVIWRQGLKSHRQTGEAGNQTLFSAVMWLLVLSFPCGAVGCDRGIPGIYEAPITHMRKENCCHSM